MPLKLNIGTSKKIGLPDYGSKGASVNLELEVDSSLVQNPGQLQNQVNSLFQLAREAVEAELFGREPTPGHSPNGTSATNGSRNGHHRSSTGRPATDSQVRALHAIANRQKIDLRSLLERQYQVGRPEDLSLQKASQLIDELKSEPVRNGGGH